MAHWNWLDWVLVIIVFLSVLTAIRKGFVAELVSLASVIAALLVAAFNYKRVAPLLAGITNTREVALGASFIILFAVVLVVGALVSVIGRKLIKTVELQWFDRILGAAFGLVRGILIDCVVLLVMMAFAIKQGAVQGSTLAPYITTGSRVLAVAMPSDMRSGFRAGLEKFKRALIQTDKKATEARPAGKADL
jgi:membrane protein required for colicin V production